jgi:hypothetical protein
MRFSYRMVPEVYQLFWAAMARGEFITDAAVEAGTYRKQGTRWLVAAVSVIIDSPDAEQLSPVMAAIYGLTPREQQVVEARRLAIHDTGVPPPHLRQSWRREPRRTRRRAVVRTRRLAPVARSASHAAAQLRQPVACWLSTEGSRWTTTRTACTGQGRRTQHRTGAAPLTHLTRSRRIDSPPMTSRPTPTRCGGSGGSRMP